jgi:hypothetical protein
MAQSSHGAGDVNAEYRKRNKVKNNGRDGICGIVQAIEKIKCQRHDDQADQSGHTQQRRNCSKLIDNKRIDLVRHVLEAIHDALQMVIYL